MSQVDSGTQLSSKLTRFSYAFMAGLLLVVIWLRLATPLLAALFTYLALTRLQLARRGGKWFAVGILLILLAGTAYSLGFFVKQAIKDLPTIADDAIPSVIESAKSHGIELPFTDYDSLKELALDSVKSEVRYLSSFAKFARGAATQLLLFVAGCVVAIGIFLHPQFEAGRPASPPGPNLYSRGCEEIQRRFGTLYGSFVTVMGAQFIISLINTILTGIFVFAVHLPYRVVVIGVTFLCGMLPVVGNLISNTLVVGIGFTVSPKMALLALIFLVLIHKLEYLLNSQIVGWRIRNSLWLTLLALIVGERLLGIPGMILAPVVLNYLRLETSALKPGPDYEDEDEKEEEEEEKGTAAGSTQ
jgi:predicted PurR-regulated permease PerM